MSIKNDTPSLRTSYSLEERLMDIHLARDLTGILAYEHHSLFTEALKFTILLVVQKADFP